MFAVVLFVSIGILFGKAGYSAAQEPELAAPVLDAAADTSGVEAGADSLNSGLGFSPILYDADSSSMNGKVVTFFGTEDNLAKINYQDVRLEAMKITLYLNDDSLVAESMTVPANPDSFPGGEKIIGRPVLYQSGQAPISGLRMVYDLKTNRARVFEGRTVFDGGFYYGENIVRLDRDFLQIGNGYYTTCDKEGPHFHFKASEMKLKIKDKVVARPVVFYIQDVPLFIIPFGLFPITGGRGSGFIMPSYGNSVQEGRHLRGMGYYYAPNDFMGATMMMDFYEKTGVFFRGDLRYSVRYKMSGNISGSITRRNFQSRDFLGRPTGSNVNRQWDMRIRHSQIISPTMNLSVSAQFVSDASFNKQFTLDRDVRTQRRIFSSATLTKRWVDSKNSVTISASRSQDLSSGGVEETLPNVSFNRSTPTYLFRKDSDKFGAGTAKKRFYTDLNFRYDSKLQNRRSKFVETTFNDTLITPETDDSPADTTEFPRNTFGKRTRSGVQHNLRITMPTKVLRHFTLGVSASYKEEWFNEAEIRRIDEENNVVSEIEKGFFARRTGNIGVSLNTKMFGLFNTNIGRLKTIRHVLTPSVSFSYRPDFSDKIFGYFATYTDSVGNEVEYDRFSRSLFGGTQRGVSKNMSISLQNLVQARTVKDDVESKIDLLNVSMNTSYNFALPDNVNKLSNLNSSFRILPIGNFVFNTSHSFYEYDNESNRTSNRLIISSGRGLGKLGFARLLRFSTSTRFELSGGSDVTETRDREEIRPEDFVEEGVVNQAAAVNEQMRFDAAPDISQQTIPWKLTSSFSVSLDKSNPNKVRKSISTNTGLEVKVTDNWRVGYRGQFDLVNKRIIYQDVDVYRDLHCWEFQFSWTPPGSSRSGFWLEIRIKDTKLRDLKVKKTDYGGSVLGRLR